MAEQYPLLKTPLRISTPYNHALDFIQAVLKPYADLIGEVYLPVHEIYCHTGRPWLGPADPDEYDEQITELASAAQGLKIPLNFVANQFVPPYRAAQLSREILRLHARFPGSGFTLSAFELAVQIHQKDPTVDIQPSTLAHIDDPTVAWYWKSQVGSKGITLHRAANKRLDRIAAIRKLGLSIRMVVNDKCLPGCPAERAHGTQIRLYDEIRAAWPEPGAFSGYIGCRRHILPLKNQNVWLVAIKDVLPGHLPHLQGLIELVKISGRATPTKSIIESIERYAAMRDLTNDGPFYEEPPEAWERITTCDRVCEACRWCFDKIKKLPTPAGYGRDGRNR